MYNIVMIEINNLTKFTVDKKYFLGVVKKVLKGENKVIENLSIAFIDSAEIQKINRKYRKKDKPTDVLSFEGGDNFREGVREVIICPKIVKKNAKEGGISFKKELTKVLIHGVLHVLGYDHEKSKKEAGKMERKQEYYLAEVRER